MDGTFDGSGVEAKDKIEVKVKAKVKAKYKTQELLFISLNLNLNLSLNLSLKPNFIYYLAYGLCGRIILLKGGAEVFFGQGDLLSFK